MDELRREVAASVAEFAHGLDLAFPGALSGGPLRYVVVLSEAAMQIDLEPQADRRIAALALPCLAVRIRFTAGSPAACAAMLDRMDRAMQRGGG